MNMIKFARLIGWLANKTEYPFDETEVEAIHHLINEINQPDKVNLIPLFDAMIKGEKINAIREHRALTGIGLKESKDEIERLMNCFYRAKPVDNS